MFGDPVYGTPKQCDTRPPVSRTILETAPLGITNGGTSILAINSRPDGVFQFLGVRFTLESKTLITGVGGHVKSYDPQYPPADFNGDRSLFVAIVPTVDADSVPDLSQAIFVAVFDAPFNSFDGPYPFQVPETIIKTSFLLFPGDYVIMFGSGLFGATGSGWMPIAPHDYGTPRYFFVVASGFYERSFEPARFVVIGSPVGIGDPR